MSPGELLATDSTLNEFLDYIRERIKDTPRADQVSTMGVLQIYKIGFMASKELEAAQAEIERDLDAEPS